MQPTLFKPISRDERQKEAVRKWIKAGCKGCFEFPTGFGKTKSAIICINLILKKYPDKHIIVVVPTTALKEQWISIIDCNGFSLNCEVVVINTASKNYYQCDLLIVDEIHRVPADTFSRIFETIKYNYILGLTATFERLDSKHILLEKYCPVIDSISLLEAQIQGWVSSYKEYQVILDVDDIEIYKGFNKQFQQHFEFFNYDWELAMSCLGPKGFINKIELRNRICPNGTEEQKKQVLQSITYHSASFMRTIQQRKTFINNHPKKLEITRKIIEARSDNKIITFSNNIKMAESIGMGGKVFSGRDSKKKGRQTIEEFCQQESGILHTIQKANEGLDIPGLSVAIILGIDSSKIKKKQRIGRVIRKEDNKQAEIFTLLINNTVELEWFRKSNDSSNIITIDENGLNDVLVGKEPEPYRKKITDFTFRY